MRENLYFDILFNNSVFNMSTKTVFFSNAKLSLALFPFLFFVIDTDLGQVIVYHQHLVNRRNKGTFSVIT